LSDYVSVVGFVQFDPQEREVNNKPIRNVTIQNAGGSPSNQNVNLTLWDQFKDVPVERGSAILANGQLTSREATKDGKTVTYYGVSVKRLLVDGVNYGEGNRTPVANSSNTGSKSAKEDLPF
jgi:hypothetical protein